MASTPIADLLKRPIAWKRWQIDRTVRRLLTSLQANIVKGHGRDHTVNMFWSFQGADTSRLRSVIRHLGASMPSALEQLQATESFKATGQSGGPVLCFFLRPGGYTALGAADKSPTDEIFTAGMQARGPGSAFKINDPELTSWQTGFQNPIDALLLVAADSATLAKQEATHWRNHLQQAGATLLGEEDGSAIKRMVAENPEGVEHFGYVDGRSQPLFLAEDVEREPRAHWDPAFPPSQFLVNDPGDDEPTSFGSFFVFRKLEQNVAGFKNQEKKLAAELGLSGGPFEERAGALIVGRFEDGSPVVLDPMPTDMPPINDFNFQHDPAGGRCPFHSHIRKVNPRGESPLHLATDFGFASTVRQERAHIMARRGITYGTRIFDKDKNDFTDEPSEGVGLLFMAYMANIENQFEFSQATWANNPAFVTANVGIDPVIGQAPAPVPDPPIKVPVTDGWSGKTAEFGFEEFVKMKGGEYFFAPSIDFLKHV
jgi:Dyp-type peroxidase family